MICRLEPIYSQPCRSPQGKIIDSLVSDFLAVGGLIVKVVEALRGTRSEYQELIRELERYF